MKAQNQTIMLTGDGYKVSLSPEAEELRSELIGAADEISGVDDEADQNLCLAAASPLQAFLKNVEATRKVVKGPVTQLGKEIDRIAVEASAPALKAVNRLRTFMEGFQMKQEQERRKIEAEAFKKREEARRAEEAAESARLAAERKKTVMTETKAERAEEKAIEKRVETMVLEQKAEATKAIGGRMELDFEVEDIDAFYNEHPELCVITIKLRDTKEYLKRRAEKENIEVPQEHGLRVFLKPMVAIR